ARVGAHISYAVAITKHIVIIVYPCQNAAVGHQLGITRLLLGLPGHRRPTPNAYRWAGRFPSYFRICYTHRRSSAATPRWRAKGTLAIGRSVTHRRSYPPAVAGLPRAAAHCGSAARPKRAFLFSATGP